MQDPKETFNNIEHNTEMALLQSEKIAESVDNLEPIMEGVLVKADDILNEQKKTNELLSKEEEPKPEVQKIELLGAELITIKGKDGENGDKGEKGDKGDTGERGEKGEQGERGDIGKQGEKGEKGDNGDTGKDGIDGLDGKDGKNGKNGKDGSPDTPKQVKEKLLKVGIDYSEIDNTPDINKVINIAVAGVKQSSKTVSLVELDDIDYSGLSIIDGKYVLGGGTGGATWGSITGNIVDQADLQNALNAKQDTITTGTTAQYFRGDLSLATFPTLVSSFTNDAGYITSSALSGYVPNTRTLTINGTAYDLSADRSWTIATPTASTGLTNTSGTWTSNLSTGISGGQSVIGGTASGNNLTLSSTTNATKGKILFGTSAYDEVNNRLGIGTTTPAVAIEAAGSIRGNASGFAVKLVPDSIGSRIQFGLTATADNSMMEIGGYNAKNNIDTKGRDLQIFSTIATTGLTFKQATGFIGINTTNPGSMLEVIGLSEDTLRLGNVANSAVYKIGRSTGSGFLRFQGTQSGFSGYDFRTSDGTGAVVIQDDRNTAFGGLATVSAATAKVHIMSGTATAGTAPLKFRTGINNTVAEVGAMEYNDTLHFTNSDATRRHVVLAPNTTKVTASAPYTNDGYIIINIGGTDFKVMTTA